MGDSQAIVLSDSGGCAGCALTTASPLFPAAAAACADQFVFGAGACPTAPSGEQRSTIGPGTVGFEDPAGVTGTGVPSGGSYRAVGAMVYTPSPGPRTWLVTCTLAPDERGVCAASVDAFVATHPG